MDPYSGNQAEDHFVCRHLCRHIGHTPAPFNFYGLESSESSRLSAKGIILGVVAPLLLDLLKVVANAFFLVPEGSLDVGMNMIP